MVVAASRRPRPEGQAPLEWGRALSRDRGPVRRRRVRNHSCWRRDDDQEVWPFRDPSRYLPEIQFPLRDQPHLSESVRSYAVEVWIRTDRNVNRRVLKKKLTTPWFP